MQIRQIHPKMQSMLLCFQQAMSLLKLISLSGQKKLILKSYFGSYK